MLDVRDVEKGEKKTETNCFLNFCLCLDFVMTCGIKARQYCCCLIFLAFILSFSLLVYKCSSLGAERCMQSLVHTFKGNVTVWN